MKLEFKRVKDGEDSEHDIILNGEKVGSIARGWLRLGGNQWLIFSNRLGFNQIGYSTLTECKSAVRSKANLESKEGIFSEEERDSILNGLELLEAQVSGVGLPFIGFKNKMNRIRKKLYKNKT